MYFVPILKYGALALSAVAPLAIKWWEDKSEKQRFIEDRLYCGYMNDEYTEEEVRNLCKEYGVDFPPRPLTMKEANVKNFSQP
jgi:hypothetical protein